jgi:hypothetical protein
MGHIEFPIVRVSGRYRVGKLLGSGTFGKYLSYLSCLIDLAPS